MLIHSDTHPVGGTIIWRVQYGRWLQNTAYIRSDTTTVVSSDSNYVVGTPQIQGKDVVFAVAGGVLNLSATITVTMRDNLGNVLPDTISLIGVSP